MRRVRWAVPASALIAGVAAAVAVAEDTVIPKIDKFKVTPRRVCREPSDTCANPGGTISFRISEFAQVRAATRPLGKNEGAVVLFKRKFKSGKHSRRFSVKGLRTGRWDMQLTAIDKSNNASHPADRTFRIVK